jgi:hypothetical protein
MQVILILIFNFTFVAKKMHNGMKLCPSMHDFSTCSSIKGGNKHDAATNYVDACTCYKKSDPNQAAASLQKAIDIYTGIRDAIYEFMITVICHIFKYLRCTMYSIIRSGS